MRVIEGKPFTVEYPTAHTSPSGLTPAPTRSLAAPPTFALWSRTKMLPEECSMRVLSWRPLFAVCPTIHASPASLTATPNNVLTLGGLTTERGCHRVPLQSSAKMPSFGKNTCPMLNTEPEELASIPCRRLSVDVLGLQARTSDHVWPSQCSRMG